MAPDPLIIKELVIGEVLTPQRMNVDTLNDRVHRIHVAMHVRPRDSFKNEKRAEGRASLVDLMRHVLALSNMAAIGIDAAVSPESGPGPCRSGPCSNCGALCDDTDDCPTCGTAWEDR